MPKIVKNFPLGTNKNSKSELIDQLDKAGGLSEDCFFEENGMHFLDTENTLLTAISLDNSNDRYELFYKVDNIATTMLNNNYEYEMIVHNYSLIFDVPKSLIGTKEIEIELIKIKRNLLTDGDIVTILYNNGFEEKKEFDEGEFEFEVFRNYKNIIDFMTKYEKEYKKINDTRYNEFIKEKLCSGNIKLEGYKEKLFWAPNKNVREFDEHKIKRINSLPSINFGNK